MNKKIRPSHVRLVVRKAWLLYTQWQQTGFEPDRCKYVDQRELADRAVAALPEQEREEFVLP